MSTRRIVGLFLLALMVFGYGVNAVWAATSGSYPASGGALSGPSGVIATAGPTLLAAALFVALARNGPSQLLAVLFAAWFVVGAAVALVVHMSWGLGLVTSGAVVLVLVCSELRPRSNLA